MTGELTIDPALAERFAADLDRLSPADERLGVAVSGGPDSLALLLLARQVRPGSIAAATVDHRLRPDSGSEAALVAGLCHRLDVPHAVLPITVGQGASVQAQAREARYRALRDWARQAGLGAVLTAHHADDQAETLLMRLARGAGLSGLAGVREARELGPDIRLLRPLLGWRKAELVALVAAAGVQAVDDPANRDPRHQRTAVRTTLARVEWLDPAALSVSAAWLSEAEAALGWAAERLAGERIERTGDVVTLAVADLPRELQRRLLLRAMEELGAAAPRGPDLKRALRRLAAGERCSLAGLLLSGGERWTVQRELRARRRPGGEWTA
jgi:tRNA(Ile)-lysidine synthase